MAYNRPAVEVIQEFQAAAAALALPSLPACVVGPAFQIQDDVDAGIYSEDDLSVSSFAYEGLSSGAIVDLDDAPEDTVAAAAHKSVGVKLADAYLVKVPALPESSRATGELATPNLFQDTSVANAFATFDPDAAGAPRFYVDIIGGTGVDAADIGRKLVIGKNSDSELVVAAEWQSTLPVTDVEYRILEFREEEEYSEDTFTANGIAKTATAVTIDPGLTSVTDTTVMKVVEATVLLSWRALRPNFAGALNAFTDVDSLEAAFGVGSIVPSNIGPFAVSLALQNTSTEVSFTGLGSDYFTNEEQSYQSALEYLETKDSYAITPCTHLTAVHQLVKSHVELMSASTVGKERIGFVSRQIVETEVLAPASGIGYETSAGTGNGTSGTGNKTFKDPTNGSFITDSVNTGHYLEITDYTAVEGVQRSITPNEADYFGTTPDVLNISNAAFVSGDVGRKVLVEGATTAGNDQVYTITTINSATQVVVTPTPAAGEAMPALCRTWITDLQRVITADDGVDAVVAATKTWTFTNGAFTSTDIGRKLVISGTSNGNDGVYTIDDVTSSTVITTTEAPAADETFTGVSQTVYSLNREPARDVSSDAVNGTSREWTIIGGAFTADDIGRKLRVTGAVNAANNDDHVIESIISATVVKTDNSTTPVTEAFTGLSGSLSVLDILASTPSTDEAAFITGTRHEISSVTSESQLVLVSDPTGGFGGTLEDVEYRITRDLTLNEQADVIAGYSSSLGSRRIVHTWPDRLAVSVNGEATLLPGYFAGAVFVGMVAGLPSQAGFTNLSITGFVGRANSDDVFSDTQLDTIAGGGTLILTQPVVDAALSVRHQLTTDVSTIYFQELSITKNVDLVAKFMRSMFQPYLGIYNITDTLMDLLKTRGEGGIEYLKRQRAPRVGAPLRSGRMTRIEESATQVDTTEIDFSINPPVPLNNVKITLFV